MVTITSRSPEETLALGAGWGQEAFHGWVIGLTGDLGSGKTLLVKGIASGLGVKQRVRSPTFGLMHEYPGVRLVLYHIDLYRLSGRQEILDAGLEEYLCRPRGIAVVEWAERWFDEWTQAELGSAVYRSRLRRVWIVSVSNTVRRFEYDDFGAGVFD